MLIKVAVFDGLQAGGEQTRHLLRRQNDPVFAMGGEKTAYFCGVHAHQNDFARVQFGNLLDALAIKVEAQRLCRPEPVDETETA